MVWKSVERPARWAMTMANGGRQLLVFMCVDGVERQIHVVEPHSPVYGQHLLVWVFFSFSELACPLQAPVYVLERVVVAP